MAKSTDEIENKIKKARNSEELKVVLSSLHPMNFGVALSQLCEQKGTTLSKVQIKSGITKSLFYAIANGTRRPQKASVIKIAFALGLSLEETNSLLKLAGHKELYAKIKEDAIIIFGINTGKTAEEIEELLIEENSQLHLISRD